MSFPEIGLAHDPKIKISKKYRISFPESTIGQAHDPDNLNFVKILDEFSRIFQ